MAIGDYYLNVAAVPSGTAGHEYVPAAGTTWLVLTLSTDTEIANLSTTSKVPQFLRAYIKKGSIRASIDFTSGGVRGVGSGGGGFYHDGKAIIDPSHTLQIVRSGSPTGDAVNVYYALVQVK